MLEQVGPELLRDPPDLLQRTPDRLLGLLHPPAPLRRIRAGQRLELKQHAREHLPDLVVEPARDAPALRLLGRERAAAALAPLGLEAVEHLVERVHELANLGPAALGQALPGTEQVDRAHALHEPIDRREHGAQQEEVGREHERDADHDVEALDDCAATRECDRGRRPAPACRAGAAPR